MGRRLSRVAGAALLALLVGGGWVHDVADARPAQEAPVDAHGACDFLDPAKCLYPFPIDYFTLRDRSTDTGRRVQFSPDSMPRNAGTVCVPMR